MQWVALAIVCTALILLSYYSPKMGFGLLGVVAAILVTLYFLNIEESAKVEFPVDRELVQLGEIQVIESYGESWDYSGRISNSSNKSITDIQIKITLHDCPAGIEAVTEQCAVIGEEIDYVAINVPARQARDFRDNIALKNAQPKGELFWNFEIIGLRVTD